MEYIGERIRQARKERKYTQSELARLLKVATTTVASWEQGRNTPPITALNKLSDVLGVSINYLLENDKKENQPSQKTADLDDDDVLFTYQGKPLSDEDRAIIKRLMNGK